MRDIEQELRELGKRTREQVGRTEPDPAVARRVKVRRTLVATTTTLGLLLVTAGGIYGASLMSSERDGTDIAAEEVMSGRYFPRFGGKGRAIVEIDVASRSVCFNLSALRGGDTFTNVDIHRTAGRGPSVLALRPSDAGFTPNGGGECVRAPNALSLQSIAEAPQQYALQLRSDRDLLSAALVPDPVELYAHFGRRGTAVVTAHSNGNVCYDISGIDGAEGALNIEIRGDVPGGVVISFTPTDDGYPCVRGVEREQIVRMIADPLPFVLSITEGSQTSAAGLTLDEQNPHVEQSDCGWPLPFVSTARGFEGPMRGTGGIPPKTPPSPPDEVVAHWRASRGFVDLYLTTGYAQTQRRTIEVLGADATSGVIHEGWSVEFTYRGCDWVLQAYGMERAELERFARSLVPRRERQTSRSTTSSRQSFAVWPYVTLKQARRGCATAPAADRTATGVAQRFAKEVLGWPDAVVDIRAATDTYGIIRKTADTPEGIRGNVWVSLFNPRYEDGNAPDCFLIRSVARPPDKRPTGVSVAVRGRTISVGCSSFGADDAEITITYGQGGAARAHGDSGGTFKLDFKPRTTGAFLIVLKDDGEVFSACGAALPAGDFAAG